MAKEKTPPKRGWRSCLPWTAKSEGKEQRAADVSVSPTCYTCTTSNTQCIPQHHQG